MILATHSIGISPAERGAFRSGDAQQIQAAHASMRMRYAQIEQEGWLVARDYQPSFCCPGRSFDWDDLAGDGKYVFLGANSQRYLGSDAYGWAFDAEQLVGLGAIVGDGDLADEYGDALWQACADVAATLPRLPVVSDDDIAAFASLMGESDPALLAYVQEQSADPTDALHDLVRGMPAAHDLPAWAVERARTLAQKRLGAIQRRRRRTGREALKLLRSGQSCEVLVRGHLSLALAVGRIEAGEMILAGEILP